MACTKICRKWTDRRGGINRLIAILLGLTAILLLVIVMPSVRRSMAKAAEIGCVVALDKAQGMMTEEYLFRAWSLTKQEAAAVVDKSRYGRDNLCPSGGDYFIVPKKDAATGYEVICGLHDADTRERARLSSGAALSRLSDELKRRQEEGEAAPDKVKIQLNGKTLVCQRVDRNPRLLFGTATDIDRKGIVCYYGLVGNQEEREAVEEREAADLSALKEGDVWYFGYADENHASVWICGKGWSGDAWVER